MDSPIVVVFVIQRGSCSSGCSPTRTRAVYGDVVPASISRSATADLKATILSSRYRVINICDNALNRLERRQGSVHALMCFDFVIKSIYRPFGEPKKANETNVVNEG